MSLIYSFVEGAEQSASYYQLGITGGVHVSLLSSLLSRCIPLDYHDFHYFSPGSKYSLYDMNSIFLCASTRQNQVKECLNATLYFFLS